MTIQQQNFEKAVEHNRLANQLMRAGRLDEALRHYAKAVQLQPDYLDAHFNLGLLFLKQLRLDAAMTQFNNVIQLYPDHISAHFYLANLYLERENYEQALREFQIVLQLEPLHKEAYNNLGVVYLKLGNTLEAIRSFSNVLRIDETHEEARNNLAAILLEQRRYQEASNQYEQILKYRPEDVESRYNWGVAQMSQGLLEEAIDSFEAVVEKQPDYAAARVNLHILQAMTGEKIPSAAPPAYVQYLFDHYAQHFDEHLKQVLQYETPEQLRQLLIETTDVRQAQWRILDLGCGTGLSGVVFRELAEYLVGVDLSPNMLEIARTKGIYDHLSQSSLLDFLAAEQDIFDLIVAADVFVYMGDLLPIFRACRAKYFLFSTESLIGNGYVLQKTARYAHAKIYIEDTASQTGWTIAAHKQTVLRQQNDQPMMGDLYLLTRNT